VIMSVSTSMSMSTSMSTSASTCMSKSMSMHDFVSRHTSMALRLSVFVSEFHRHEDRLLTLFSLHVSFFIHLLPFSSTGYIRAKATAVGEK